MTVLERNKSGATLLRRRRDGRPGRVAELMTAHERPAPAEPTMPDPGRIMVTRRQREAVAPQDQAIYTCQCGYVFEAPVSTSVGCPHCGGSQAW
jgi:hypothetical protein